MRIGQLSKEERKAVNKAANKEVMRGSFDHTHICNQEIGSMLTCFEANAWDTAPCLGEIRAMYDCVDEHKDDPDPKVLARRWQSNIKRQVFQNFVRAKVLGRLAR